MNDWFERLCVVLRYGGAHHRHPHIHNQPPPTLEQHIMSLSAKAQALADELAGLPALIAAEKASAIAAVQAQSDTDLDGLKPLVDAVSTAVAAAAPAAPAVTGA